MSLFCVYVTGSCDSDPSDVDVKRCRPSKKKLVKGIDMNNWHEYYKLFDIIFIT
jgi:hypothetical protein